MKTNIQKLREKFRHRGDEMSKTIKGYKFITPMMKSKEGNVTWKLGKWKKHRGKIELCKSGFHACLTARQSFEYIYGDFFCEVEARGNIIHEETKFVASDMRIVRILNLNYIAKRYALWCAKQCLQNYEKEYPNDKRVSYCLNIVERFLEGNASLQDLKNAQSAAARAIQSADARAIQSAARAIQSAARAAHSSVHSLAFGAARAIQSAARAAQSAARAAQSAAAQSAQSAARAAQSAAHSSVHSLAFGAAWSSQSAAQSAARAAQEQALKRISLEESKT